MFVGRETCFIIKFTFLLKLIISFYKNERTKMRQIISVVHYYFRISNHLSKILRLAFGASCFFIIFHNMNYVFFTFLPEI